jgi:hypothetical protein
MNVPGIDVTFYKGTAQVDSMDRADRVYVWAPGACFTFPLSHPVGRVYFLRYMKTLQHAYDAGLRMRWAANPVDN